MKRTIKTILLIMVCTTLSGCLKRDNLEGVDFYTTTYPVEYITDRLYGYNSEIYSIYPDEIDVNDYELTEKQIENYSEAAVFVYNGLTKEKEIAREFLNKNDDLQIIDVSYGLKYTYGTEELWLSPNNYLMLATNIKNSLHEFITNKFIKEEIDENFADLEEELSLLDAELRSIASNAEESGMNTIVVSDPLFKFLANYGFNIIDISDTETEITNLESSFENETYNTIFVRDDQQVTEEITKYVNDYDLKLVVVDIMTTLDETQRKENDTYLTIMANFIEDIRNSTINN